MKCNASVDIAPKMMAEAFWNMDSKQQAMFFVHLYDVIKEDHLTNANAYGLGELQWLYMSNDIEKFPKAKEMACAMTAQIFVKSTDYLTRIPQ
jgi:hypothetical protein